MAEKAIFTARAVVYYFDSAKKSWTATAVGQSFCRADMYENSSNNSFRVIGRGLEDPTKIVINSNVTKETSYTRASETFHQWSDNRYIYGLNFGSKQDADVFGGGFDGVLQKLKSGGSVTPPPETPPAPKPQVVAPSPPAPTPPKAPTAPVAPTPPAPPKAPAAPPAPAPPAPPAAPAVKPPSGEGRGALLSSITGFQKGGLKKAVTVDKSSPIIESKKEGGTSSSGGGSGGGMMAEMMAKRKELAKKDSSNSISVPVAKKASTPPSPVAPAPKQAPMAMDPAKNSLKKSTPAPSMSQGGGSNLSGELATLKEEILNEMRRELQQMKEEILAAIGR